MATKWVMTDNFAQKEYELYVNDDGTIASSEKGMDWVEMMTRRYGEPTIEALMTAGAMNYSFFDTTEVRKPEVKKDDSEVALMEISKTDEDQRLVFGWAYQTHDKDGNLIIDKSGEYVEDPDELERAAYNFVIKSRAQGDMHKRSMANEQIPVGTMVESMVFTPEKIEKMGLPKGALPTGWWTGFRVNDDDAWAAVKRGERKSFSIHGKAVRKEH